MHQRWRWWQRSASLAWFCSVGIAGAQAGVPPDAQLQADAQKELHARQYRAVEVRAENGVVSLSGRVPLLADKLEAAKRVEHTHEAGSVQNNIVVDAPPGVSDAHLFSKLGKALTYDRQGYGTLPFNSLTLQIAGGVAILGGLVVDPVDKDSAVSLVTHTPGIRALVDHLQVAPLSPNDNAIRRAEFQAVYGTPQLNRYALNPAKPIRIVVVNGRVTLTGVVDSQGDREIAGLRANGVPGVFAMTNDLQVAGQGSER